MKASPAKMAIAGRPATRTYRHFIAYWKWADWNLRKDDAPDYHSNARILNCADIGDVFWVFTRNPAAQTLHLVEAFKITNKKPEYAVPPWRYGVEGKRIFPATFRVRWLRRDWARTCFDLVTMKGRPLGSTSAGEFCQRIQQPREVNQHSSDSLRQTAVS